MAKENQEEKNGIVKEYFDAKGKQSVENRTKGGEDVEINLVNKTTVEFIKDFGFIKKGHVQDVSDVAYDIYNAKGVIKKL